MAYLANQSCLMMGIGGGADGLAYWGLKEVISLLQLRQRDLEECMIELMQELKMAEDLLSVVSDR